MANYFGSTQLYITGFSKTQPSSRIKEKQLIPDAANVAEHSSALIGGGSARSVVKLKGYCTTTDLSTLTTDMAANTSRVLNVNSCGTNLVNENYIITNIDTDIILGIDRVDFDMTLVRG